jgi:hypothetical protein
LVGKSSKNDKNKMSTSQTKDAILEKENNFRNKYNSNNADKDNANKDNQGRISTIEKNID